MYILYAIILANVIFSYMGFRNRNLYEKYMFNIGRIQGFREYYRIFTSGFLHVDWRHLGFNMLSLFFVGPAIIRSSKLGIWQFVLIYFASLIGGSLFSWFVHRNKSYYRAVGASGAVSGVLFSLTALMPMAQFYLFGILPVYVWLYTLIYVVISIYGIQKQTGNIGHEAHLGGGVIGLITIVLLSPSLATTNHWAILLVLVPSVVFIAILILNPNVLLTKDIIRRSTQGLQTIDDEYNERRLQRQKEIDRILDKISEKGMNSLTAEERKTLDEHSQD